MTHLIAFGPEFVMGFHVIPMIDITFRSGVGFANVHNADWRGARIGLNWRVIPGVTLRFGIIGISVEAGYAGNWLTQNYHTLGPGMYPIRFKHKTSWVQHGAQIGVGIRFHL